MSSTRAFRRATSQYCWPSGGRRSAITISWSTCAASPTCASSATRSSSTPRTRCSCRAGRGTARVASASTSRPSRAPRWRSASTRSSWRCTKTPTARWPTAGRSRTGRTCCGSTCCRACSTSCSRSTGCTPSGGHDETSCVPEARQGCAGAPPSAGGGVPEARHGGAGARPSAGGLGAISGPPERQMSGPDLRRIAERVLRLEADAILALVPKLDAGFARAVETLRGFAGRVIVTGMGKSGLVGRKIAATLASTGTPAYFLHPAEGVHGDLGMVARGDVVLALSNSGETDEVLAILPPLKRLGVPIVLLTGNPTSTLARQCEVVLDVSVPEEACPMNLAPTSSTTAALAVGDALAMVLLELRGLRPEDYAALHPRGTLGWRALLRVADLMLTGEAVPLVGRTTPHRHRIVVITKKRRACATALVAAGRLVGVITDGDRRRLHLSGTPIAALSAGEVATREPKTIHGDDLAAKALEVMETWQITSLVIVDGESRPIGLIHMHDILRAKIV